MVEVAMSPAKFEMVNFDHDGIVALVVQLASELGVSDDASIEIEVDEASPLMRIRVESVSPMRFHVEGGAFEDTRRPREQSDDNVRDAMGRLLLKATDRMSEGFADAPGDDELTLAEAVAWEVYSVGRLVGLGGRGQRKRRLYQFRNRHGFTNTSDEAFEMLWAGKDLTWADVSRISNGAKAVVN
ncbi:MAG: hypothetical protein GXP35_11910 [Actinobacteria bacterium]|nr:hypothetical protein [Actinomycetota bacterium]